MQLFQTLLKNHEVFDDCTQLLKENKSLLVFPEADHGEEYYTANPGFGWSLTEASGGKFGENAPPLDRGYNGLG